EIEFLDHGFERLPLSPVPVVKRIDEAHLVGVEDPELQRLPAELGVHHRRTNEKMSGKDLPLPIGVKVISRGLSGRVARRDRQTPKFLGILQRSLPEPEDLDPVFELHLLERRSRVLEPKPQAFEPVKHGRSLSRLPENDEILLEPLPKRDEE